MTAIIDYTSLQTAIIEYLAREQDATLIARVPTFIQLCEAKLNRALFVRQMEQRSSATITAGITDSEFVLLPSDFQSMRRVRLTSVTGQPRLDFMTQAAMDEYRFSQGDVTGQPLYFAIFGSEMEIAPTPDTNYTVEMVYRQNIPALASNSTNWLLTLAPDLYLYGALLESAPYIKDDARLVTWGQLYTGAKDALNELGQLSTYNSGPLQMRMSGVTP